MIRRKCFVPDTPSFCANMWSHMELFSEISHNVALVTVTIAMETRPPEKLVMVSQIYLS